MSAVGVGGLPTASSWRTLVGGLGPVPVFGGLPEGPWRDGEEGQSRGFHKGDAGSAHVRLQ